MAQMPGRCAKDQQSEPMAAPPRHIIEPLPHWLDPLEIMMPPEQRLETWIILRADQPDLQLIQNGLFFDLGQTIWLRHPRNLKKLAAGVQSKVSIPLSRAVFHILMSQPWAKVRKVCLDSARHEPGASLALKYFGSQPRGRSHATGDRRKFFQWQMLAVGMVRRAVGRVHLPHRFLRAGGFEFFQAPHA